MSDLLTALFELPPIYARVEAFPPQVSYLAGCSRFEQFCNTLRGLVDPDEYCPFCEKEHQRRERTVLAEQNGWMLIRNEFPHKNVAKMGLIVPQRHVTDVDHLHNDEGGVVFSLFKAWRRIENAPGGGMLTRFGNPLYHVGTVDHVHVNLIEPKPGKTYRPPLAKNPEELATDYERMIGFRDELILKGGADWLFSPEGIAATLP